MIHKILRKPQAVIGLAMMLTVFAVMVFAPAFAPNDPEKINIMQKYAEPSEKYPLGTDDMGRCIASRLIYGARVSMSAALPTIAAIAVISVLLATVCAYIGGIVDRLFVIVSDIFMALPPFLVAMTLVGLFESKALSIVISISAAMWVWNAQVVRTYVIREKNKPYSILHLQQHSQPC